jgi:hypothetical protein
MSQELVVNAICWALIVMAPINAYIVWHGWSLNRSVEPRSPVLRALLWAKFSIWFLNLYFAIIGVRVLANLEPVMPFGGFGLGLVILFILTVPVVIHSQMKRFVGDEKDRTEVRDAARDEGRDSIRDEARDIARDAEHDVGA